MTITKISEEELERDPGRALKAADRGSVFLVEEGKETFVLLNIEECRKLRRSYKLAFRRK